MLFRCGTGICGWGWTRFAKAANVLFQTSRVPTISDPRVSTWTPIFKTCTLKNIPSIPKGTSSWKILTGNCLHIWFFAPKFKGSRFQKYQIECSTCEWNDSFIFAIHREDVRLFATLESKSYESSDSLTFCKSVPMVPKINPTCT